MPAAATLMLSAWRQVRAADPQPAPLVAMTCLVSLVSEFAGLDLVRSSVSSRPCHPTVSASHLAPVPLIVL